MKIRSGLLVACMIVVPLQAMFSHLMPAGAAVTAGRLMWEPIVSRVAAVFGSDPAGDPAPAADRRTPAAGAIAWRAASGSTPAAASPEAAVLVPPAASPPAPNAAVGAVTGRLVDLGATAIECRPMPGAAGRHRATCQIPVDAAGQLHRVFQATGPDRSSAERNLLAEVLARKHRMAAARPTAGTAASGQADPRGLAF